MSKRDYRNMISISYKLWIRTCIGDNTHAFIIEAKNEELLEKVEEYYRKLYPDIRDVKQFVIAKKLGRNEYSSPIAYALRDRYLRYVITRRDIELELRNITKEKDAFVIKSVDEYEGEDDVVVLGRPTGCPWIPQSTF